MYARILAPPATDSKGHFAMPGTNKRADVDPAHRLSYALPHGMEATHQGPERQTSLGRSNHHRPAGQHPALRQALQCLATPVSSENEAAAQRRVTEAFALVGAVATGFATVEFHLQFLLSTLLCGKELALEAMLDFRRKTFAQRIEMLNELVASRLPEGTPLRRSGEELVTALTTLRETRNLYVHGYWLINYPLLVSTGGVRCSDTKWRLNPEDESWQTMTTLDISLGDLQKQIEDTGKVYGQIHALIAAIREQFPPSHPNNS
jgi:hypothetical protein